MITIFLFPSHQTRHIKLEDETQRKRKIGFVIMLHNEFLSIFFVYEIAIRHKKIISAGV